MSMTHNSPVTADSAEVPFRPGNGFESTTYPGLKHRTSEQGSILVEYDAPVPMRDGVKLRADVFLPLDQRTDLPVLLVWSPYGKHGEMRWSNFDGYDLGFDTSELEAPLEYPEPIWWTAQGYAVVFVDMRGAWGSEGQTTFWGQQEAEDGYDAIEWAAAQPWSNGKVGMIGTSNLAWAQWYIAATQPPHLAAISPWEGVSDFYREFAFHGGIPETNFLKLWGVVAAFSERDVEDVFAAAAAHPLIDEYWESKGADLSRIEVPALVGASWSDHGLHTRGTLEAFKKISSQQKWLVIHGAKKWAEEYAPDTFARQLAFFDRFLKGVVRNEVDEWPRVVLEPRISKERVAYRAEDEWPLARTHYEKLYLGNEGTLVRDAPANPGEVSYDSETGQAVFDITFDEETELTGYSALHVWFSAETDDADVFVALKKLDTAGNEVHFDFFSVQEDGNAALGWLRASHRELDESHSTPEQPVHTHRALKPLDAGEPALLDIEIWPSSTTFAAGETLRLVVQGTDINKYPVGSPTNAHHDSVNKGTHTIRLGGAQASHLLVPAIRDDNGK